MTGWLDTYLGWLPPWGLMLAATAGAAGHLTVAYLITRDRDRDYQFWGPILAVVGYLFLVAAHSYMEFLAGWRTMEEHWAVVRWVGIPLWSWCAGLIWIVWKKGEHQKREDIKAARRVAHRMKRLGEGSDG